MNKIKVVSLVLLLFLTVSSPAIAAGETPASLRIFPGQVANLEANPALLGFAPYNYQLQFNSLSLIMWSNAWTVNQILENFNEYWDEEKKSELLGAISGDAFSVGMGASSNVFFGFGSSGVQGGLKAFAATGLDKDFFELALFGNELDEEIHLDNSFLQGQGVVDIGFSHALDFPSLAQQFDFNRVTIGGGIHYLNGLAYAEVNTDGTILISSEEGEDPFYAEGEFNALYSARGMEGGGGHGAAIDIGAWGQINPKLGVGISLNNLGFIRWSGVRQTKFSGEAKIKHPLLVEEGEEWIEYEEDQITDQPHDPIIRSTPISLEGGVHYVAHPKIHLGGTIGLYQAPVFHLGISAATRFFYPQWLPVTVGLDFASHKGTPSLFAGFGIKAWGWEIFNFTISDIKLATGSGKEVSLQFGSSISF